MNREQWSKLTDDERRIKVAELCGWTRIHLDSEWLSFDGDYTYEALVGVPAGCVWVGSGSYGEIPNYLHDLNAMHDALMGAMGGPELVPRMQANLILVCGGISSALFAHAYQQAEAFVLTMGGPDGSP